MFYVSVLRPVNDSANDDIMLRCIAVLCFCVNKNEKKNSFPKQFFVVFGDNIRPVTESADGVLI